MTAFSATKTNPELVFIAENAVESPNYTGTTCMIVLPYFSAEFLSINVRWYSAYVVGSTGYGSQDSGYHRTLSTLKAKFKIMQRGWTTSKRGPHSTLLLLIAILIHIVAYAKSASADGCVCWVAVRWGLVAWVCALGGPGPLSCFL